MSRATTREQHFDWDEIRETLPVLFSLPDELDYARLDPEIVESVRLINDSSVAFTLESCAGHENPEPQRSMYSDVPVMQSAWPYLVVACYEEDLAAVSDALFQATLGSREASNAEASGMWGSPMCVGGPLVSSTLRVQFTVRHFQMSELVWLGFHVDIGIMPEEPSDEIRELWEKDRAEAHRLFTRFAEFLRK